MSFYGPGVALAIASMNQKQGGYCPPPPPKPSFWDSWKGAVVIFVVSLGILAGLLFALQPSKKPVERPVPMKDR